jgi:glutathione synthase/RimK-type ligase-like ATP-grasp enzyme
MSPSSEQPRRFTQTLASIAQEFGHDCQSIGGGWVLRFTDGRSARHSWGFNLEINSSASHLLAGDKSATAHVLRSCGLASIEHHCVLHPRMGPYAPRSGSFAAALDIFRSLQCDCVVKDNNGTAGLGVYRVRSERALEAAMIRLFNRVHAISIAPFVDIRSEKRFVFLDDTCLLAFEKIRPCVTGDGVRTFAQLVQESGAEFDPETAADAEEVIPAGADRVLSWRHNLSKGAHARELNPATEPALQLAAQAMRALNLRFASVDIVQTDAGPAILEANSGVMLESVRAHIADGDQRATSIYRAAYKAMWGM